MNNKKTDLKMRLSSAGHAYFVREFQEQSYSEEIPNQKNKINSEVIIKKEENEFKIENNFNIDLGIDNNRDSINLFVSEDKSPQNSPKTCENIVENLLISDECIFRFFQ